ncbi:hypothetical protein RHSIM_Rhsim07G0224300 [Rhododendron simsii]|uniref:THO1-MOS11 C-terminal domain-containing protein n=1 Tax=Rhododendron simsii TaxID=118357 RepID=A0A834GU01_RHOSS|nr:hypothetical protein RHSIM_Rhsim07G0224300 [Rhododendron simsii]
MATSTAPKEENSTTTSNDASPAPQLPPPLTAATDSSPKEIDEPKSLGESPTTGDAAADPVAVKNNGANNDDVTVSYTQKKMRRAERFGVPVQISEEEKRNTRAERFGSVQSVSADEEAKKKARLSRFTAAAPIDPLEEEKKKARALRFSQAPSGSPSQVNGKANDIETVKNSYHGQGWWGDLNAFVFLVHGKICLKRSSILGHPLMVYGSMTELFLVSDVSVHLVRPGYSTPSSP